MADDFAAMRANGYFSDSCGANVFPSAQNGEFAMGTAAMYYNDAKPDKIFYQGLALLKLGRMDEANGRFHKLTSYGEKHLFDKIKMDYFAVSLPDLLIWEDDLTIRNVIHCKYMMALGYWGLNQKEKSVRLLSEVERLDINHQGIQAFRSLIG